MNPPVIPNKPDIVMPPLVPDSTVINTTGSVPTPPKKNRNALYAIVAIVIFTVTTLSGFILLARPVLFKSKASTSGTTVNTTYQCQNIKAYSEDGVVLYTASSLSALTPGTKVRLVAGGTGSATNYQGVRFLINGTLRAESTLKNVTGDYYDLYTIPSGVTNFAITAQLKGADGNWY